ncbi:MAG TPA: hypothetical protein PKM88_15130 [bacterium]|nr:hypothetical protein [bacterium]
MSFTVAIDEIQQEPFVVNFGEILAGIDKAYAAYDPYTKNVWGTGDTEEEAGDAAVKLITENKIRLDDVHLIIEKVNRRRASVHFHC